MSEKKIEPIAESEARMYLQARESTTTMFRRHEALRSFVSRFRQVEPRNFEAQKQIQMRRLRALHRLDICKDLDPDNETDLMRLWLERTVVLTIDGGGYYILWTLQLLKELEEIANSAEESGPTPFQEALVCRDLFDVVAGTSSGAIASALIVKGRSAAEIEEFWIREMPRMHGYRNKLHGAILDTLFKLNLRLVHDNYRKTLMALDPPLLDKTVMRDWARSEFGNKQLGEFCEGNNTGLFIISKNVQSGHTVPAGALLNPFRSYAEGRVQCEQGHDKILVRAALEAAVSPPMARQPLGQYIDAGYGSDADPTLVVLGHIYKLRNEREQGALTRGAEIEKAYFDQRYATSINRMMQDLEIVLARLTLKNQDRSQIALHSKKTTTVLSFSTSFARVERIPPKLIQKPLFPLAFWQEWLVNDFYLKGSQNAVNLLNDPANFPHLDYRRFNLALGKYTLRGPNTLGPYDTHFGRLPGISGTSTASVSEEDLYYLRSLVDGAYMPFYIAIGKATVEYLRARAEGQLKRLPSPLRSDQGFPRYLEQLEAAQEECRASILVALNRRSQEALDSDEVWNQLDYLKFLRQYSLNLSGVQDPDMDDYLSESELRSFDEIASGIAMGIPDWPDQWYDSLEGSSDGKVFREFFAATVLFRGTLRVRAWQLREFVLSDFGSESVEKISRKLINEWKQAVSGQSPDSARLVDQDGGEYDIETALRNLHDLADHIWHTARPGIKKLIRISKSFSSYPESAVYIDENARQSEPERVFKPMTNSFQTGLRGELLDYQANPHIPQQSSGARERIAREIVETLGKPEWVDSQPANEPRQGIFAFPLPTLVPPYFQEHDNPLRRWNLLSKEYEGDY